MIQENVTPEQNEENPQPVLQEWWEALNFEGKEFCVLNENGDLFLKATPLFAERLVANLSPDMAEFTIKALQEKYHEVAKRTQELDDEWNGLDDKTKLYSKVSRLKDYLQHTNAIGDFNTLSRQVIEKENELSSLMESHYKEKLELVQEAEEKSKTSEDWKETNDYFKHIIDNWKETGFTDKERSDELWNRLEKAKDVFYERKRVHYDEQEKIMLQNLDIKMEIVDRAEQLANTTEWRATSEAFHQLMEKWKETGRTMHDKNEELWNRFITAKNIFFENKQAHYYTIQQEQQANLEKKQALLDKAEALKESKDWNATAKAYGELMEEWKKIGRVPKDNADELWKRLCDAKDYFFDAKRQHHETVRISLDDNYAQKLSLLKRANKIKDASQWRTVTDEMNELMEEWKKIGAVPREHSNKIWEEFIAARKYFFARKDEDREQRKSFAKEREAKRLHQKKSFLDKLHTELKEEQEKLKDFNEALSNIAPGDHKEEELKTHLNKLIAQCNKHIAQKENKILDVTKEFEALKAGKPAEKQESEKGDS